MNLRLWPNKASHFLRNVMMVGGRVEGQKDFIFLRKGKSIVYLRKGSLDTCVK